MDVRAAFGIVTPMTGWCYVLCAYIFPQSAVCDHQRPDFVVLFCSYIFICYVYACKQRRFNDEHIGINATFSLATNI